MSLNYGITCVNDSGQVITSPATLAALYAGQVTCSITSGTQTFDFPNVPAGALYAIQLASGALFAGGTHTWVITSSAGHARIVFTFVDLPYRAAASTTLRLFATNTFEPDYGINAMNDFGERVISTIFPACRFIEKLILGTTLYDYASDPGAVEYELRTTTNASEDGLLFWSLPSSTSTTVWWSGGTTVAAGQPAKMYVALDGGSLPSTLPQAFVFQTGPMTVSTQWGIRVFDGAGQVMFDGATESMKIEARLTGVDYPYPSANTYTLPSGYTPAMYFPAYVKQRPVGSCVDGFATMQTRRGMMRRNGTSLFTLQQVMIRENDGWDCRRADGAENYEWGMGTDLFVPIINAQRYGGSAI